jgi:hypothetical protein
MLIGPNKLYYSYIALKPQFPNYHKCDNHIKPSGNYIYHTLTASNAVICIYELCMVVRVNSDYFLKQHLPTDLCNGEVWCSL